MKTIELQIVLFHKTPEVYYKQWTLNGWDHRDNDQPSFSRVDGYKSWWDNNRFIRDTMGQEGEGDY